MFDGIDSSIIGFMSMSQSGTSTAPSTDDDDIIDDVSMAYP
jgi:hypothetical protein